MTPASLLDFPATCNFPQSNEWGNLTRATGEKAHLPREGGEAYRLP